VFLVTLIRWSEVLLFGRRGLPIPRSSRKEPQITRCSDQEPKISSKTAANTIKCLYGWWEFADYLINISLLSRSSYK
jgi:hypothetical protein